MSESQRLWKMHIVTLHPRGLGVLEMSSYLAKTYGRHPVTRTKGLRDGEKFIEQRSRNLLTLRLIGRFAKETK